MAVELRPAVFLDKDGTLVENVPYNIDPRKIRLQPGVAAGLPRLRQAGYLLVMVTNQSGIARGYFREDQFVQSAARLNEILFKESGAQLDAWYYCPHHPQGSSPGYAVECACRKPRPGMLLNAARDLSIDLPNSWMVGDILDDMEAGNRAGCRTILIDGGNETDWLSGPLREPDFSTRRMNEAVEVILRSQLAEPGRCATGLKQARGERP